MQKHLYICISVFLLAFRTQAQEPTKSSIETAPDSILQSISLPFAPTRSDSIVNFARLFLGKPYRSGSSNGYSFDCSGFTSFVFRNFGYQLKRSSAEQAQQFEEVSRHTLLPGDLVFFNGRVIGRRVGHVGIVLAPKENGEFDFIHSASSCGVSISNSESNYYARRYMKAVRVVGGTKIVNGEGATLFQASSTNPIHSLEPSDINPTPVKTSTPALYHRVKRGENLSSIAQNYGVTVVELKKMNHMSGSKLLANQRFLVREGTETIVESSSAVACNSKEQACVDSQNESNVVESMHTVQKGETLFSIAKKYSLTVAQVKQYNHLSKDFLAVGQKIKVSGMAAVSEEASKPLKSDIHHKVRKGETLYSIAKKYHCTVESIKKANNLETSSIHPDKVLIIVN